MLSEEMVNHLPDKPQPDVMSAWFNHSATKWFIDNLRLDHQRFLEESERIDTGSIDTDTIEFYRLQGKQGNTSEILDSLDYLADEDNNNDQ